MGRQLLLSAATMTLLLCTPVAFADDLDVTNDPYSPDLTIEGETYEEGTETDHGDYDNVDDSSESDEGTGPTVDYQWVPACSINRPGGSFVTCPGMYTCPSDTETKWMLWARELPNGDWTIIGTACYSGAPPETGGGGGIVRPQVTDAMVEREVKRIGLPSAAITVQPPGGATLINFDTIFSTRRPEFARTVGLLGYSVDIEATPTTYLWHHGDGTSQTSDGPGSPYPAKTIVHRYTNADVTVRPSVDVTYEVRWRVGDADWHALDTTLTASGPSVPLQVKEGTALLTDPYT